MASAKIGGLVGGLGFDGVGSAMSGPGGSCRRVVN